MASDDRFEPLDDGRVVDHDQETVFSPNQIDEMKEVSDSTRDDQEDEEE